MSPHSYKLPLPKRVLDSAFYFAALIAALASIIFLSGIIISIFGEGISAFREIGFVKFLFGTSWHPTMDEPEFGMLSMIVASLVVTSIALVIAVPLGIGCAVYISEIAKPKQKELLKPIIELLAGIPSVIYGLFGMAFLAPFLRQTFNLPTGLTALTAAIILGIMIIPIIASISEDAINSVPKTNREASLALGANQFETIIKVVLPAAKSGLIAAVVLGFGRAVGETMVVLMVAGNALNLPLVIADPGQFISQLPGSLVDIPLFALKPVRPMPSTIAAEMGESAMGSIHFKALFGIAVVLFIVTFVSNIITESVKGSFKRMKKA